MFTHRATTGGEGKRGWMDKELNQLPKTWKKFARWLPSAALSPPPLLIRRLAEAKQPIVFVDGRWVEGAFLPSPLKKGGGRRIGRGSSEACYIRWRWRAQVEGGEGEERSLWRRKEEFPAPLNLQVLFVKVGGGALAEERKLRLKF